MHLAADRPPYFRIDGALTPVAKAAALSVKAVQDLAFSILSREQEERFEKERELDFAFATDGVRFRVNVHFEKGAVGLAARVIPAKIPTPKDIELPNAVVDLTRLPHGLILVSGPAGSGKSTTLAAMIELINNERAANIITLEDPIEFIFAPKKSIIKQRELGSDTLAFAEGLKRVLRQDPNVVMVGEMRDLDTIATTITLAETGHLVIATLHTYSAAETVERIIDAFPPHQQLQIRLQLAASLRAVVCQQLLPRKGGGRIAAREILIANPAVANLIREGKAQQIPTVIQTSAKSGMTTLAQDLKRLIKEGMIDAGTAEQYVVGGLKA